MKIMIRICLYLQLCYSLSDRTYWQRAEQHHSQRRLALVIIYEDVLPSAMLRCSRALMKSYIISLIVLKEGESCSCLPECSGRSWLRRLL